MRRFLDACHRRTIRVGVVSFGLIFLLAAPWASDAVAAGNGGPIGLPGDLSVVLEYAERDLQVLSDGEYHRVLFHDMRSDDDPDHVGRPEIPIEDALFLLPPRQEIAAVRVQSLESIELRGEFLLRPIQPRSIPGEAPQPDIPPDPIIYQQLTPYPGTYAAAGDQAAMRGYELATIHITPVQYFPARRALILHTRVEITVDLEPLEPILAAERVSRSPARPAHTLRATELDWIRRSIRNPRDFDRFYPVLATGAIERTPFGGFEPTDAPSTDGPAVQMVIITSEVSAEGADLGDMVGEFQRLADWKTQKGVPTVVRTLPWIRERFAGPDDPAKVRGFIKAAYVNWGTDWVLLGGDIDVVPGRRLLTYPGTYPETATIDSYYGGLDGDWDLDNDGRYGENLGIGYEADGFMEVWIGRAPVHQGSEAAVFVDKNLTYSRAPSGSLSGLDPDYYTRYLGFCTEFDQRYWDSRNPTFCSEAIAQRILPGAFDKLRMYRYYGEGAPIPGCWYDSTWANIYELPNKHLFDTDTLKTYFSDGVGYAYHMEHSNAYTEGGPSQVGIPGGCPGIQQSGGDLGREDVDELTNGPNLSIVVSRGCDVNGFEFGSVSERWLLNPNGGAVAYFGQIRSIPHGMAKTDTMFIWNLFPNPISETVPIETIGQDAALTSM